MPFKERLKSGRPRKRPKPGYVPQNWAEYNQSLRKRGMVSLYLPKGDLRSQLINEASYQKGLSGRESVYTPAFYEQEVVKAFCELTHESSARSFGRLSWGSAVARVKILI